MSKLDSLNTVSARGLAAMVRTAARANRALYVHGSFGLGKSQIIRDTMNADAVGVVEERLSQVAPEDAGILLPRAEQGDVFRAMPDVIRRVRDSAMEAPSKRSCLFLDEFNSASGMTQAAFGYELLHDGSLSGYKLPANTVRIAAGNLATDRGVTQQIPAPAANRCAHVMFTGPSIDEWQFDFAIPAGVNPALVTALREMPVYLCGKADPSETRTPTPRSWHIASDMMSALPEDASQALQVAVIAACVGDDAALKVKTILSLQDKLPTWAEVLNGTAKVPSVLPAQYFAVTAFAYRMTHMSEAGPVMDWIGKLPLELQSVFVRSLGAQKKLSLLGADLVKTIEKTGEMTAAAAYLTHAAKK